MDFQNAIVRFFASVTHDNAPMDDGNSIAAVYGIPLTSPVSHRLKQSGWKRYNTNVLCINFHSPPVRCDVPKEEKLYKRHRTVPIFGRGGNEKRTTEFNEERKMRHRKECS